MRMVKGNSTREGIILQRGKKNLGQEASGGLENLLTDVGAVITNGDVGFFNETLNGRLGFNAAQGLRIGQVVASNKALNLNMEGNIDAPNLVEEVLPAGVEEEGNF